ncbi:hypothetical protein WJX81_007848 [Elliptochloris bilobata]|uniref:HIT domain-containing protein n=1 Tax=Elliptochloris bilobata TaxID=381761 RepID=A0AAW1RUJ2_9CHLO
MNLMSFQSSRLFGRPCTDRSQKTGCIFCDIIAKGGSKLIYEDERLVAFKDIRPGAAEHLLVVPKVHIATLYVLRDGAHDACLVEDMLSVGCTLLEECAPGAKQKFGFRYPRFNRRAPKGDGCFLRACL